MAPALVRVPSLGQASGCIPSVLQAASGALPIRVDAQAGATKRIAINPKNHQCVCRLYEEVLCTMHAGAGRIDENSLRAFTLSIAKGTPLLLGRGAARGADARRLQGRPDLVLEILLAALPSLGRLPVPEVHRVEAVVAVPP